MLPFEIENRLLEIRAEIERRGAELIEASFRRNGPRGVLTFIVDKPGGITLDECAALNRALGETLDRLNEGDFIQGSYLLEVNSPGLDRPLKTDRDFERALGETLEATYRDAEGRVRTVTGKLTAFTNRTAEILGDAGPVYVGLDQLVKAVRKIEV